MTTLEQDRQFFEKGIAELQDYLLSNELYWTLSGPASLPRLTLGGLLLARVRLSASSHRVDSLATRMDQLYSKWRTAWKAKADREVRARFDLWKNYLADYRESPQDNAREYPVQVRYRAMLEFLARDAALPPGLADLDAYLRTVLIPADFVWEAECAAGFPPPTFWFLYAKLRAG